MGDSIRNRLVVLVVAVAAPLAALAAYQIREAAAEQRKSALAQLQQLLAAVTVVVSHLHRDAEWLLSRLAEGEPVRKLDPAVCTQHETLSMFRREFVNLLLLNAAGEVICSARPVPQANFIPDRHTFDAAMQGAGMRAGDVIAGAASGQHIVVFALPVRAADGARGQLALTVGLRYLESLLLDLEIPPGFAAGIVDRAGTYIARVPDAERFRARPGQDIAVAESARTFEFRTVPETGWRAFAGVDEALLAAPQRAMMLKAGLATLVVLALTLWVAAAMSRRIALQWNRMRDSLQASGEALAMASEEERAVLARELHDHFGQLLTALHFELKAMQRAGDAKAEPLARCLAVTEELLDQTRDLSLDLRPAQLDELGLSAALRSHIERHFQGTPVTVAFAPQGDLGELPPALATTLYRVAQEALTNVLRHSGAQRAEVELRRMPGEVMLRIRDDGRGFDPSAPRAASHGLRSMHDRASLAGGRLEVRSAAGNGTTVELRVPLA